MELAVELPVLVAREIRAVPMPQVEDPLAYDGRSIARDVVTEGRRRVVADRLVSRLDPVPLSPVLVDILRPRGHVGHVGLALEYLEASADEAGAEHVVGVEGEHIRTPGLGNPGVARPPQSGI